MYNVDVWMFSVLRVPSVDLRGSVFVSVPVMILDEVIRSSAILVVGSVDSLSLLDDATDDCIEESVKVFVMADV